MDHHTRVMDSLVAESRERRAIRRQIQQLSEPELVAELKGMRASSRGSIEDLRDRLLRAYMRHAEPENELVPWYERDEETVSATEELTRASPVVQESHCQPTKKRRGRKSKIPVLKASSSSEAERSTGDIQQVVAVSVHSGCTSPTSLVITTPAIVTTTATTMSSSCTLTTASNARPIPSVILDERVTLPGYTATNGWTYCSARILRGPVTLPCSCAHTTVTNERPHVIEATPRLPPTARRTDHSEKTDWYTPRQDIEEWRMSSQTEPSERENRGVREYYEAREHEARHNNTRGRQFYMEKLVELSDRDDNLDGQNRDQQQRRTDILSYPRDISKEKINHTGKRRQKKEEIEHSKMRKHQKKQRKIKREKGSVISFMSSSEDSSDSESDSTFWPRDKSSDSSDTESEWEKRRSTRHSRRQETKSNQTYRAVKCLKDYNLSFSGAEREDPEEFLESLRECKETIELPDQVLLKVLPNVFTKEAKRWYRGLKDRVRTWRSFEKAFKTQFIREYDEEDLIDDLRRRTQGKGERIATFLSNFRYIVSKFKRSPSEKTQLRLVYRNLLPEYRRAVSEKLITSLDDLEHYGRKWEKQKDLDSRYAPPPPPEKMRVIGAAFTGTSTRSKVAAVESEDAPPAAAVKMEVKSKEVKKSEEAASKKKQTSKPKKLAAKASVAEAKVDEANMASRPTQPTRSYANVVKGNRQSNPRAYPASMREVPRESWREQRAAGRTEENWTRDSPRGGYSSPRTFVPPAGNTSPAFRMECYHCHAMGHKASTCPEVICFKCGIKGHISRSCYRQRVTSTPRIWCQVCDTPNVTFKSCRNCAPLREKWGNGQAGERRN